MCLEGRSDASAQIDGDHRAMVLQARLVEVEVARPVLLSRVAHATESLARMVNSHRAGPTDGLISTRSSAVPRTAPLRIDLATRSTAGPYAFQIEGTEPSGSNSELPRIA